MSRASLTLCGSLLLSSAGLDYFKQDGPVPQALVMACTLIAYVRPFVIGLLTCGSADKNLSRRDVYGWAPDACIVLTLLHHILTWCCWNG